MRRIIVNYHYIRAKSDRGIYACTIEKFQKQVEFLAKNFTFVSVEDVFRLRDQKSPGAFCALTFDDGLTEHYRVAFPVLRTYGIRAAFFPIGLPLAEKRIPVTHKLHILFSRLGADDLAARFERFFPNKTPIVRDVHINPLRHFEDVLEANLKETLISLSDKDRLRFIEDVFSEARFDEAALVADLFLSADELREMHSAGMDVGVHGYNHTALDVLTAAEQREEINRSQAAIADILGRAPRLFVYPYGRYNNDTLHLLKESGFHLAFTIEERDISANDVELKIPRYDTNSIPIS